MSYYIVRDLKIVESPVGGYVMQYRVADSNCFTYSRCGKEVHCEYEGTGFVPNETNNFKHYTKEEIERAVLVDYFKGNYHYGSNKYNRLCKKVGFWYDEKEHHPLLNKYFELDKQCDVLSDKRTQISNAIYALEKELQHTEIAEHIVTINESIDTLKEKLEVVTQESSTLYDKKVQILEDTLYYLLNNPKEVNSYATVKPFILLDDCGRYVSKMNKATYRYAYVKDYAKVFTDRRTLNKYSNHSKFRVQMLDN